MYAAVSDGQHDDQPAASTRTSGAVGVPGSVYSAEAPSTKHTMPADGEQAVAGHGELEHEQHDAEPDEQQAGDVERQAAEADERQDDRDRTEDARHEVRVLVSSNSRP